MAEEGFEPEFSTDLSARRFPDFAAKRRAPPAVHLVRSELEPILGVYAFMVARGEWRDYAIGAYPDHAEFDIFRHTAQRPVFSIEKWPGLAQKQGAYLVRGMDGRILKRGRAIESALGVFDRLKFRLMAGGG